MAGLEIILAAVLTLLGLIILCILLARWTRRRQNVAQISRINSEQCAGLLDNEDGIASARPNRGKTALSVICLKGPPVDTLAVQSASSLDKARSNKAIGEPLSGNAEHITGTIGPIMQFSTPISGATGPINLSQKTFGSSPLESACNQGFQHSRRNL